MIFLLSAHHFFFKIKFYGINTLTGIPSELLQTVWIQTRTDILSVLIKVKTVCKSSQQKTLAGKELNLEPEHQTV